MRGKYPTTKEIIYLIGMGTLLVGTIFMPGLGYIARMVDKAKREAEWRDAQKQWKKFNPHILKRNLKRLRDEKIVEVIEQDGIEVIKLTQKGRTKYLKFKLEEISFKGQSWDGKWRLIIYDIAKFRKREQESFRNALKYMNFLMLQKSVYMTPYSCEEQIQYLREYFGVGAEVILIRADQIENEGVYKEYFGL